MKDEKEIKNLKELTYTDVAKNFEDWKIAVIPWGAIEPHGEHLPYLTDSILASTFAELSVEAVNLIPELRNKFICLPCISMGLQNLGQVDKDFCINFSLNTQYQVIEDIIVSLQSQEIKKLVIINGHNGNDFKPIVRDFAVKYPNFKIYVCDYLSIVDLMRNQGIVNFPDIDDHAAFTETSLMLYHHKNYVNEEYMEDAIKNDDHPVHEKQPNGVIWSPRNFDKYSHFNRIGKIKGASSLNGELISNFIRKNIVDSLIKVYYE